MRLGRDLQANVKLSHSLENPDKQNCKPRAWEMLAANFETKQKVEKRTKKMEIFLNYLGI